MSANDSDLLGWIGPSRRIPASEQRAKLTAAGVRPGKVCEIGKDGVMTFADVFGDGKKKDGKRGLLRAGTIICVCGLPRLAPSRPDLGTILDRLALAGAYVRNVLTGRTIDPAHAAEVAEAYREYTAEGKSLDPDQARKNGAKGGRARIKLTQEHKAMWRDLRTYPRNIDAAMAISRSVGKPVSVPTLRRRFKDSGRTSGPMPVKR